MKERTLIKTAIATALIGIIILLLLTTYAEIPKREINTANLDEYIEIEGEIINVRSGEKFSVITILQEVDVVLFEETNLKKGQRISVQGKVSEYEGEKQMVAEKIIS